MKKKELNKLLYEVFECGVDYGQLLMEEERESEETFDAYLGHTYDKKHCMPNNPASRRQLHSEKWFKAKRKGKEKFFNLLIKYALD